jgi:hypothetical protein
MNSEPPSWTWSRWFGWVFVVFVSQLALIFWLGDRKPFVAEKETAGPGLTLAANLKSEVLALADPTLFALPHQQGFSGPAWLNASPGLKPPLDSLETEESAPPLALETSGTDFAEFIATNHFNSFQHFAKSAPALTIARSSSDTGLSAKSMLRQLEGLASRRLISAVDLPSWPVRTNLMKDPDILTNTVIQLVVNAEGKPISAALISSSGLQDADKYAMEKSLSLRFEPMDGTGPESLTNPLAHLTWGQLSFDWLTVSTAGTNEAIAKP